MEKSKAILQSLLPVVMWLAIQSVVSLVFLFWRDYPPYFDGVLINSVTLLIGGFWYQSLKKKEDTAQIAVSPTGWIGLALLGGAIQFCTSFALTGISGLFPPGDGKLRRGYGKFGNVQPYLFLHSIYHAFSAFCRGIDFQRTDLKNIGKILSVLGCQYFTSIVFRNNTRQYYSVLLCLFRRFVIWRCNV